MPVNRYQAYMESATRLREQERAEFILDVAQAVAGALGGKGIKEAIEKLTEDVTDG